MYMFYIIYDELTKLLGVITISSEVSITVDNRLEVLQRLLSGG